MIKVADFSGLPSRFNKVTFGLESAPPGETTLSSSVEAKLEQLVKEHEKFPDLAAFCKEAQQCFNEDALNFLEVALGRVFSPAGRTVVARTFPLPGWHDLNSRDLTPSEIGLMLNNDSLSVNKHLQLFWKDWSEEDSGLIPLDQLDVAKVLVLQHLFFYNLFTPGYEHIDVLKCSKLIGTEKYSEAGKLLQKLGLSANYPELARLLKQRLSNSSWSSNVILAFFEKIGRKLIESLRALFLQTASDPLARNLERLKSEITAHYLVCSRPKEVHGEMRIAINRRAGAGDWMAGTDTEFTEIPFLTTTSLIQAWNDLEHESWWAGLDAGRQRGLLHLKMYGCTLTSDFLKAVEAGAFEKAAELLLDPESELSTLAQFEPHSNGVTPMSGAPTIIASLIRDGKAPTEEEGLPSYNNSPPAYTLMA